MSNKKNIEYIKKIFPEMEEIKNKALREKVAEAWLKALKESDWDRLEDVPFNLDVPEVKLIEHVKAVFKATKEVARIFSQIHKIPIDNDYLLAGVLLHDVSKVLEYSKKDGRISKSEIGNLVPHGYYGAHIALDIGLPIELAHLIITHTNLSPMEPKKIEGVLIHYIDFCNADFLRISHGIKTYLAIEREKRR